MSLCFSASAVGFFGLPLARISGARGAEMAWVKNADESRFSGLAKETLQAEGEQCRRGCEPVLDIGAPEKPGGPLGEARADPTCE